MSGFYEVTLIALWQALLGHSSHSCTSVLQMFQCWLVWCFY